MKHRPLSFTKTLFAGSVLLWLSACATNAPTPPAGADGPLGIDDAAGFIAEVEEFSREYGEYAGARGLDPGHQHHL